MPPHDLQHSLDGIGLAVIQSSFGCRASSLRIASIASLVSRNADLRPLIESISFRPIPSTSAACPRSRPQEGGAGTKSIPGICHERQVRANPRGLLLLPSGAHSRVHSLAKTRYWVIRLFSGSPRNPQCQERSLRGGDTLRLYSCVRRPYGSRLPFAVALVWIAAEFRRQRIDGRSVSRTSFPPVPFACHSTPGALRSDSCCCAETILGLFNRPRHSIVLSGREQRGPGWGRFLSSRKRFRAASVCCAPLWDLRSQPGWKAQPLSR